MSSLSNINRSFIELEFGLDIHNELVCKSLKVPLIVISFFNYVNITILGGWVGGGAEIKATSALIGVEVDLSLVMFFFVWLSIVS